MSKTRYPNPRDLVYIRNNESKRGEITHRGHVISVKLQGEFHGRIEVMIEYAKVDGHWKKVKGRTNHGIPVDDFTYLKDNIYVIEAPESILNGLTTK